MAVEAKAMVNTHAHEQRATNAASFTVVESSILTNSIRDRLARMATVDNSWTVALEPTQED